MATLHHPNVDPAKATNPSTTEDPISTDQQWTNPSHDQPTQSTSDPNQSNLSDDKTSHKPSDPSTIDPESHTSSNPQQPPTSSSSNPHPMSRQHFQNQSHPLSSTPQHHQKHFPQRYPNSHNQLSHPSPAASLPHPTNSPNMHPPNSTPSVPSATSAPPQNPTGSKIFVGGLSWETDEDSLRRYFEQIGRVTDCVIMRDRHTGHPRGFGFVTFESDESAVAASSRRHDLDGRQVEAKRAVPRSEGGGGSATGAGGPGGMGSSGLGPGGAPMFGPRGNAPHGGPRFGGEMGGPHAMGGGGHRSHHTTKCKVFVGGLPSNCGPDEFRNYFSRFGEVMDAQVMIDHNTGNSRGFGFVTFANESTVSTVVGPGKSNTDHEIMGKSVEVKRAEPKGTSGDRRHNRDSYSGPGGGMRGGGAGNDSLSGNANGGGTNAAAAAAAAYYSNYPASLAEQYGAYYNNPQWQQYYAAMGYNFNAFPQGYSPYQQYLQAYMSTANATNGATAGMAAGVAGDVTGNTAAVGSGGNNITNSGATFDGNQGGSGRYGGTGGSEGATGNPNGHGAGVTSGGGGGAGSRRASRREDRYHPYR